MLIKKHVVHTKLEGAIVAVIAWRLDLQLQAYHSEYHH